MGALSFSDKKLGPTWGAVYRKWKIKNHFQDSKIDQRSVDNSKKENKRNTHITNNQNNPQNNLYWEWKKVVRIHYKIISWQNFSTQPENCDHKPATLLSGKKRIPVR